MCRSEPGAMRKRKISPRYIADHIRRVLKDGGSAPHAARCTVVFQEEINRAAGIRQKCARSRCGSGERPSTSSGTDSYQGCRPIFSGAASSRKRSLQSSCWKNLPMTSATRSFAVRVLAAAISSWADHDALVHYLIAPMIATKPARVKDAFGWAKSENRWHRRAACVALIQGTRPKMFLPEIMRLSNLLLADEDDMVQKGLGWLLRETAKTRSETHPSLLMQIRDERRGWCCARHANMPQQYRAGVGSQFEIGFSGHRRDRTCAVIPSAGVLEVDQQNWTDSCSSLLGMTILNSSD